MVYDLTAIDNNKVGSALSIIEYIFKHRDQGEISAKGDHLEFITKDRRVRYTIERALFNAAEQVWGADRLTTPNGKTNASGEA